MILRRARIVLAAFLIVSGLGVHVAGAVPCVSGPVSSIASTGCSIGDLQFNFGALQIRDDAGAHTFSTSTIAFAPNATNPLAPGFTLTGNITQSSSSVAEGELDIFGVRVTTLSSLATIAGLSASVTGTTSLGGFATLFAEFNAGNAGAQAQPGIGIAGTCLGVGPGCSAVSNFASAVSDTGALGTAGYGVVVSNATATNSSASFFVNEIAGPAPSAVPEPATLLLFGTTAAGLGLARWRQRKQQ